MNIIIIILAVIVLFVVLFYILVGSFKPVKPKIVTLEAPIKVVGISVRTTQKTVYKDVVRLGKQYKKIKEQIQHKKEPWGFATVSKDFEDSYSWMYMMGDVVTSFDNVPEGIETCVIPATTYAVFPIRPKSRFAWGISIGRMKKFIYTEWIKKAKYELDNTIIGDFEYHDERSVGKNPMIDLYVAIKEIEE